MGLAWGAKGPGPDRLGFWLGGQGSWAGPAWFWLGGPRVLGRTGFHGGPRVLGRAGLAFIFRLDNSIIFRLVIAINFRLDTAIIFRLATAIIFRLDTAINFRLDAAIIFRLYTAFGPKIKPSLILLTLFHKFPKTQFAPKSSISMIWSCRSVLPSQNRDAHLFHVEKTPIFIILNDLIIL